MRTWYPQRRVSGRDISDKSRLPAYSVVSFKALGKEDQTHILDLGLSTCQLCDLRHTT